MTNVAPVSPPIRFNKSKAAKALGLARTQLYVRMRKYGLDSGGVLTQELAADALIPMYGLRMLIASHSTPPEIS